MTTRPAPAFAASPLQPRPQTWFQRNWKWFIALIVVLVIVVLSAFMGGIVYFVESALRTSHPYQLAVKRATESPVVAAKLGTPLHIGWFVSGSLGFNGSEGSARLGIPVSGPNGKGSIIVVGKKHANHWNFETLELDVSGQDEPIPLLDPALDTSPVAPGNAT
jgi:hypothetical protein